MFATTGIIQGNTVLTDDYSLEKYNGRKVIITVLEEDKPFETIADDKLFATSDALINQNMEAYKELAKWFSLNLSRDENLLDSALKSPFQTFDGSELYPDILDKASQLCYSLVENHPFADGNNASGKMNKDDIKAWFLTHRK